MSVSCVSVWMKEEGTWRDEEKVRKGAGRIGRREYRCGWYVRSASKVMLSVA